MIVNLSPCFEHFVPGKRKCNLWRNRGSNLSWVFRLYKNTLSYFRVPNSWIGSSYVYCIVYDTRSIIVLTCGCQTLTSVKKCSIGTRFLLIYSIEKNTHAATYSFNCNNKEIVVHLVHTSHNEIIKSVQENGMNMNYFG